VTAPTTTPEIDHYLAAVRSALADLSAEDRDDLMEDVASHLAEIAAELRAENTGSLETRLGKPADYAAELRSSAGLPVSGPQARQAWRTGLSAAVASSPLGRGLAAASDNRQVAALRAFLPELRPGWWVFRGYLAVWLLSLFFGNLPGVIPTFGHNALPGVLFTAAAIWASVRLGRHWLAHPPRRGWLVLGTGCAVLAVLLFVVTGFGPGRSGDRSYTSYTGPAQNGTDGLESNIYAFDSDGKPLTGVQLFDQDGQPIELTQPVLDANGNEVPMISRFNTAGIPVNNVFPRVPANGVVPVAPFAPPRLAPSGIASPSPAPGQSAAASPSPGPKPSTQPSPR